MLLCKNFCDISSDLPNRDYKAKAYNTNNQRWIVKELSQQMVSTKDEIYEPLVSYLRHSGNKEQVILGMK